MIPQSSQQLPTTTQLTVDPSYINSFERAAFDSLFYQTTEKCGGILKGQDALKFFMQSGLPQQTLIKLWDLCDLDKDGGLDKEEFAIAMHLARLAVSGTPLPEKLPLTLVPESKLVHFQYSAIGKENWANFQTTLTPSKQSDQNVKATTSSTKAATNQQNTLANANAEMWGDFDFNATTANTEIKFDGEKREVNFYNQTATHSMPSASFEQRVALQSDLTDAIAKRKKN